MIRRELSYLSELYVPENFTFLGLSYAVCEDIVLTFILVAALSALIHARRYLWAVLQHVAKPLYFIVAILALLQYLGENGIGFSEEVGVMVEEGTEAMIYMIALVYLWRFPLQQFKNKFDEQQTVDANVALDMTTVDDNKATSDTQDSYIFSEK